MHIYLRSRLSTSSTTAGSAALAGGGQLRRAECPDGHEDDEQVNGCRHSQAQKDGAWNVLTRVLDLLRDRCDEIVSLEGEWRQR